MNLDLLMNNALVLVPVILAVVQGFKLVAPNLSKWAPLVSLATGIMFAWLFYTGDTFDFKTVIGQGIIGGLSASGLFSGIKATAHATDEIKSDADKLEP